MNVSTLMLELSEPFAPERVSWRIARVVDDNGEKGKAQVLAYIDARDVMDRLDYVCGLENWQCRYSHTQTKTVCDIGIRINGEWVWKADGAGDTDIEAEKGALSDAFKRAAVRWGIARYLYDLGNSYAAVTKRGKNWFIDADALKQLEKSLPAGGSVKMTEAREVDGALRKAMALNTTLDDLRQWAAANKKAILSLPARWQDDLRQEYTQMYSILSAKDAA